MKRIIALACVPIAIILLILGLILGGILLAGSTDPALASCAGLIAPGAPGSAPPDADLATAIKDDTVGNPELALGMFFGSWIENRWKNTPSKDGAFGWWQIQDPGNPDGPNPNITVPQAENAAYSTNYMLPRYRQGISQVDPNLWVVNPEEAAEETAYYSENPKYTYYQAQGAAAVHEGYLAAKAEVDRLGITGGATTSSPSASPSVAPAASISASASASPQPGCAGPVTAPNGTLSDPGPGPQDFSASGVFFGLRPRAVNLVKYVQANWDCSVYKPPTCVHGYGGWRKADVAPDHPGGYAVDFTIANAIGSYPSLQQVSFGWGMACFLQTNASKLGIQYIIWQGKIFNVKKATEGGAGGCGGNTVGWRDYSCVPYGTGCSLTEGHYDHIHVSLSLLPLKTE
jgi:hypothetical protein